MFLSIITPTFNRAYILSKCYESLKNQTLKDFEWIVVDDGSADNTEELVKSFILESALDIKYVKQENAGKHIAHNTGAELAKGELFLCLDSDDMLTEDAVETIKSVWEGNKNKNVIGILAKRGDVKDRKAICASWSKDLSTSTMFDLYNKHGFYGDTALFFKTEILKKEKFISFSGERFMPETALYSKLDKYGEMLLLDKVLYLTEYLPDGLTCNFHNLLKNNPNGTAYSYYEQLLISKGLKQCLKYAMLVNIYKSLSKNKKELKFGKRKFWLLVALIPAHLYKKKFLSKFSKGETKA